MMIKNGLFTSESVSDGHPDKICDQISDAILDTCLAQDQNSRVAVEVGIKGHKLCIFGEITTEAVFEYKDIALSTLASIGHSSTKWGLNLDQFEIITEVSRQSPEISSGVDSGLKMGAGDQGMMFGFACSETEQDMPLSIILANQLMQKHKNIRSTNDFAFLGPDAKAQITIKYRYWEPIGIDSVVFSTQHTQDVSHSLLQEAVIEQIVRPVVADYMSVDTTIHVNPAGPFTIGGPLADAGVTGRKIIVDTYGGHARHGGGAFSGKDPTKVDRSGAYAARQLAKQIVALELASICEVRVAYAIGIARPMAISIDTLGTGIVDDDQLLKMFSCNVYDLFQPYVIIERLDLQKPIYKDSATFGHFGRKCFPWEQPMDSLIQDD
ncbi:MAG: methionine adenosyltransferase [Candidatus Lariskella arthropodorum]